MKRAHLRTDKGYAMTDQSGTPMLRVFLSSVSKEFRAHREMLRGNLTLPDVKVQEQSDFIQGGGTLLEKLDAYIHNCDAVIHLVVTETAPIPSSMPVYVTERKRKSLTAEPMSPMLSYWLRVGSAA